MDFVIIDDSSKSTTICLNMIVKNESKIITRLFDSVLPIIDSYCICDTGSTDNTISLIEKYFKERNIPGKIIEHEFINFQINRNIALKAAQEMAPTYILLLDADMQLEILPDFDKSKLTTAVYNIKQGSNFTYSNTRLISSKVNADYYGVTHEYIDIHDDSKTENLGTLKINDIGDGGCKGNKAKRDIELLTKGLEDNPKNIRYNFYLANTYYDMGDYNNAIKYYEIHATIVSWNEEEFYNYYRQGICYKQLRDYEKMSSYWIKAWSIRPTRVESLYELIQYHRYNSNWNKKRIYYEIAKQIEFPKNDILFVHKDIYDYKLLYEYTIFGYYVGARNLYREMAKIMSIPNAFDLNSLLNNYKFYCPYLDHKKCVKITDTFTRQMNGEYYDFRSSTPSIIQYNGKYAMNLRYVNYNIQANGAYDWVKNIVSINKFVELNNNLETETITELDTIFCDRQYEGIEDIKLINVSCEDNKNKILFTGTVFKKNNKIGIAGGEYNCKDLFKFNEYSIEDEAYCEKNWVFLPGAKEMVYQWSPLRIGKIVDNKLVNMTESKMPHIFSLVRGSTNCFKYKNELWFIVHLVHQSEGEPRFYYHIFVKFSSDMTILSYTVPLKFSTEPIEYCCGLIVEDNRIIVSYSVWDRESYIKCYEKKYIESFFDY